MKQKTTNKRKNILSVLVVISMLAATLLTACSSSEKTATSTKEDTAKVETAKQEITEPVEQEEPEAEEIATPEPTIEPTPEPTPAPTPDIESTLPGIEWIQTFDGIVDEPKLVVFNDETNKKIIVEDCEEVEFYDEDTLAVYIPKDRGNVVTDDYLSESYEEIEYYDNIVTLRKIPSIISRGGYSSAGFVDIEFDGQPMRIYYLLKLMG